jgi:hypothetical protein
VVEHTLGKGEVMGSIPITGFRFARSKGDCIRITAFVERVFLGLFGACWVPDKGPIKDPAKTPFLVAEDV